MYDQIVPVHFHDELIIDHGIKEGNSNILLVKGGQNARFMDTGTNIFIWQNVSIKNLVHLFLLPQTHLMEVIHWV